EAMVGDKPARVHCNTCRSQHGYRAHPPAGDSRPAGDREAGTSPRPKATKVRAGRYQSLLKEKSTGVVKPYSPTEKYETGDVLQHPTFGRGVATAIKDENKVEVLFETGSKLLIHGR